MYIVFGIIPYFFMMIPGQDGVSVTINFNNKLRMFDIILLIMSFITFITIINKINRIRYTPIKSIIVFIIFLFIVVIYSYPEYQINSFGEFRYFYIILFLPLFIGVNFSKYQVRNFFKSFIIVYLVLSIILYFILSFITGLGFISLNFTGTARIFPSDISLGIFLSSIFLLLSKKYNIIKLNNTIVVLLSITGFVIVLFDNHRSVWLFAMVTILFLLFIKEIRTSITKTIIFSFPILIVIILLLSPTLLEFIPEIDTRLLAITNPESDPTANWRLLNWDLQLQRFYKNPVIGGGLGGYWGIEGQRWDIGVMPHNMYVIILAKLGIIGLILFITPLLLSYVNFKSSFNVDDKENKFYSLIGTISIISILTYSIAYALDFRTTWIFFGLALAYFNYEK